MGDLETLRHLSFSHNSFQGAIPPSLGNSISLEFLDLSSNGFTGSIPRSLENLLYLRDINLSFNHLQGEIPSGGVFANSSVQSFRGNDELCGLPRLQVPPCASNTPQESRLKKIFLNIIIHVIASVTFVVALVSLWIMKRHKKGTTSEPIDLLQITTHQMIPYHKLQQATNNFNESNLLGVGEYGTGGIVPTSGDVYSCGIMLMETFTKRKPTEEMFTENSSLRYWVKSSYPTAGMKIVDAYLFNGEDEMGGAEQICISSVIELALDCSRKPQRRGLRCKKWW
ncbi:hypothetical protein F0562_030564 [Nyssa sinensis]|uniref:Serine-threonine/tyrosine-protein kinase catalytic domain-containing protein n=1 Tax=Nyssa sinensis TaxID=561372 RepID=A0A5J5AZ36_9ASTE|nr:hypothetical protein F0562_030564 [Nyssa sinensis]